MRLAPRRLRASTRRAWSVARKELRQVARDPLSLIMLIGRNADLDDRQRALVEVDLAVEPGQPPL